MSDQDFFFDEDEKPAEKPAAKAGSKQASKAPAKGAPAKAAKNAPAQSGGLELTWTITALIAVVALLLGVIVGYAIPKSGATASDSAAPVTGQEAPQLTPEQMSTGELPPGHPSIGGSTGATGSATTTSGP